MITQVKIKNFRNIDSLVMDLKPITIITGVNGIGKSNSLNSISWFSTGTLLTDKWGFGENDNTSVIKIGAAKGQDPSVTLVFDSGVELTKVWETTYDKRGNINGHKAKYYKNNTQYDTEKQFKVDFYNLIDYRPYLAKFKETDELRMLSDPLYALQKLDPKELRLMLIELGCDVSNEEIFKSGNFDILRPYESKYVGDFTAMEKDLKKTLNASNEDILKYKTLVDQFANLEPYNEQLHLELKNKVKNLYSEVAEISNRGADENILKLELELKQAKAELERAEMDRDKAYRDNASNLKTRYDIAVTARALKIDKENNSKISELGRMKIEQKSITDKIMTYNELLSKYNTEFNDSVALGKTKSELKSRLAVQLADWKSRTFEGLITCPNCGAIIPVDESAQEAFDNDKSKQVKSLIKQIEDLNTELKSLHDKCVKWKQDIKDCNSTISKLEYESISLDHKIEDLSETLKAAEKVYDDTEIREIKQAIAYNESIRTDKTQDMLAAEIKVSTISAKIIELKNNAEEVVRTDIAAKNAEINDIMSEVDKLTITQSSWATLSEYEAKLNAIYKEYNTNEALYYKVKEFTNKQVELVNLKAKEITGIDFVMLEKNITNDDMTKVCYATVNGVPFKDVNTSEKIIVGVKFIERVKALIKEKNGSYNSLPILADRMEGIDYVDKIFNITNKNQFICTRVGTEKEITVM